MTAAVVCLVALGASALTFFSGFGLGTLLLPAFALFYPIELAIASTAVVHFLNSLFKLVLVGRGADRRTVLLFGLPAIAAAFAGAWALHRLTGGAPLARYEVLGIGAEIVPAKLVVGALLLLVTAFEIAPGHERLAFPPRWLPLGGALSGFMGGLTGMQGALRSAFLIRAGLSKEAFIATGVVVAAVIDVTRLGVYTRSLVSQQAQLDYRLLAAAVGAAFAGALLGNRFLPRLTLTAIQRTVAAMLAAVALGLMAGLL